MSHEPQVIRFRPAMRWSGRHGLILSLLALAGLLGPATGSFAQGPEPVAREASPPSAPRRPIPLKQLAAEVERVKGTLDDLERPLARDAAVLAVEKQLADERKDIERRLAETRAALGVLPALGQLESLEAVWQEEADRLAGWDDLLGSRIDTLEKYLARAGDLHQIWELTAASAKEESAPPVLLERIRVTLSAISATRNRIEDLRDAILVSQNVVAQQEAQVAEVVKEIRLARRQLLSRLLVRDAQPMWEAWAADRPGPGVVEQIERSLRHTGDELRGVVRGRADLLPLGIALFIATLLGTHSLRRWSARWDLQETALQAATQVFQRPFSAAVVLWVLLTPFPYGGAPPIARRLAGLIIIVPILRVLQPVLERRIRVPVYLLACFWVVDRVRDVLENVPLLERTLFAGETALAIGVLLWARAGLREALAGAGRHRSRVIGVLTRGALAALVVALLANGLGYVRLAKLLGDGTLRSAYAGTVLYVFARLLEGVIVSLLRSRPASALRVLEHRRLQVENGARGLVRLGALGLWGFLVLAIFNLSGVVLGAAAAVLTAELRVGAIAVSLRDALAFGLTVWVAFLASRLVRTVLEEEVFPRVPMKRGIPYAVSTFAGYAVLLVGFSFAFAAARVGFERLTLLIGALGVGIGFGLQNVVNNFVSGVILLFERPIQIGDTVQMGDLLGEVRRIGLRSSTIHTWEGAEVIVPNANLISEQVVNWTLSDRKRRIDLPIGVAYGSDPERVLALLVDVARRHPAVLAEPGPSALFLGFGDSSLDFQLRAWTGQFENHPRIRSDLAVGVNRALGEAGIAIPFPQRDLHLRSVDPALHGLGSGRAPTATGE